jgi:hypothetical protein
LLGALIRKFWPGLYEPVPLGEKKLATHWADYEAAECPPFGKASDAVYTKFWVRNISRVLFIVFDPTVLTHFFYA